LQAATTHKVVDLGRVEAPRIWAVASSLVDKDDIRRRRVEPSLRKGLN